MKTTAIIPTFDNEDTIGNIIKRTEKRVDDIIVINDGSTDSTRRTLRRYEKRGRCTVITHKTNLGKGAAIRSGITHLKKLSKKSQPEVVILMDGDGEHRPGDIPRFIRALKSTDVVLGARTLYRTKTRKYLNTWMGAWFRILDQNIRDPACGFRAFKWSTLDEMELHSSGFNIDAEIILEAVKAGASISSIHISSIIKSRTTVSQKDYIRINNFFDEWILRNRNAPFTFTKKRTLLLAGARIGSIAGKILLLGRRKHD